MNVWMDGLDVLYHQAWAILSILMTVVWGQIIIVRFIKNVFKDNITSAEYVSLGITGSILPFSLWAVLLFFGVIFLGKLAMMVGLILALAGLLFALFRGRSGLKFSLIYYALILFFAVSIILQLAFLRKVILPMYFDSAEHYRIIKYFVDYFAFPGGDLPLTSYYHVGYHFLNATVSHVYNLGIVDTMLVFGQIVLAVLPLSLFFIVRQETRSETAAVFACLLAAFGWHMPSHLMNWGKYPALFSLLGIYFVLNMGYLICRNNKQKTQRLVLYLLFGFGILISILIHTRSLIVFAFMAASVLLTIWRVRLPIFFQHLAFVFVLCVLAVQSVLILDNSALAPLFGVYFGQDLFVTGLIIFLFIFSAQIFTDLTFFLLTLLAMLLAGLFVPVTVFSSYGALTLLDRPYVQMLLYFPLSLFGGMGLAGLHQFLQRFMIYSKRFAQLTTLFVFGLVVLNAKLNHSYYPSDCCQIVSRDDLVALQWVGTSIPLDANILIASTELFITSFEPTEYRAGVDGGVWIPSLTSRRTAFVEGELNFSRTETHAEICEQEVNYIYIGSRPLSFNAFQLDERPDWYQITFFLPKAKVYQVIGCE